MDPIEFQAQFVDDGPPTLATIFARALAADRGDLDEARRAAEDQAAREERRENLALLNRQAGDPLGQVNRCQLAVSAARDEVNDLRSRLADAEERLARAAGALVDFETEADQVLAASARRSQTPDMLAEAKRVAAELRVEQLLAARSQAPGRRPKGHGGNAVRADQPVTCQECIAAGASPAESFLIHQDPDGPVGEDLIDLGEMTVAAFGSQHQAERRTHGYAEVSR